MDRMRRTNFYFPLPLLARVKSLSEETGTPMSELIRRAIEQMLKENGK
jgi:predicted DNA-binding protein